MRASVREAEMAGLADLHGITDHRTGMLAPATRGARRETKAQRLGPLTGQSGL